MGGIPYVYAFRISTNEIYSLHFKNPTTLGDMEGDITTASDSPPPVTKRHQTSDPPLPLSDDVINEQPHITGILYIEF